MEKRCRTLDVLGSNGLTPREPEIEREKHIPRAEGDDERRKPKARYEDPVDGATRGTRRETDRERQRGRPTEVHGESARDYRREHHDGTDGEVDARGQDDQRLGDAQNPDDRYLLQDKGKVKGLEEPIARENTEHRDGQHEHHAGGRGRVAM